MCALLLIAQAASSLSLMPDFFMRSSAPVARRCNGAAEPLPSSLVREPAAASAEAAAACRSCKGEWCASTWHNLGARAPPIRLVLRGGGEGEVEGGEEESEVSRLVSEGWAICGEGDPLEAERLFHAALRKVGDPAFANSCESLPRFHPPRLLSMTRAMDV